MRETLLTILAIVGGILIAPLVIILAPIILALASEDELKDNGLMLSSRERYEKYNK